MLNICYEIKTKCVHCSNPLMLNAFVMNVLCPSCNKMNEFGTDEWRSLLSNSFEETVDFEEGEGQPSTIMRGTYTYQLMYGKQAPRCRKCKTNIDESKLEEYAGAGSCTCSKCSNKVSVRKPDSLAELVSPDIKYLVGEEDEMFSAGITSAPLPQSSKPVLFTCPSCAGNLEIDGSARMIKCKYCSSEIYLPDDLWLRLHPVKEVQRWYLIYSTQAREKELKKWYYTTNMVIDSDCNSYMASAEDGEDDFIVWSFSPDMKTRWVREGLKFDPDRSGMCLTNDGNLYLWSQAKHSLLKLSTKDGSTIQKIEGKPSSKEDPYSFDLKGCISLVSDVDGSIFALLNNVIARYTPEGKRTKLWEGRFLGLFGSGVGKEVPADDDEYAPCVKEIHSQPKRVDSDLTRVQIGLDGYMYMIDRSSSDGVIARFDRDGNILMKKEIPLEYKDCMPCADKDGTIYIVGTNRDSNTRLIRMSPNGSKVETLLTDIKEGGVLDEETEVAIAPNGNIYIYKFYNRLKIFSPDMKMIYRSKQSEEDDENCKKKMKEQKEKDEDI